MKNRRRIAFMLFMCIVGSTGCSAILPEQLETITAKDLETVEGNGLTDAIEIIVDTNGQTQMVQGQDREESKQEESIIEESDGENGVSLEELVNDLFHDKNYYLETEDGNYKFESACRTGDFQKLTESEKKTLYAALCIIKDLDHMDDYEKTVMIHNRLSEIVTYGYSDHQYEAYGALVEEKAVCQGYADAFKLCMDLCGIPCITVGGSAGLDENDMVSHAWNMVRIKQKWYHIDVTWDDGTTKEEYGSWCHLFLFDDDKNMEQTHRWTDLVQTYHGVTSIPKAEDDSLYYYVHAGKIVYNQNELESMFERQLNGGNKKIEICCEGFEPDSLFAGQYTACFLVYSKKGNRTVLCYIIE